MSHNNKAKHGVYIVYLSQADEHVDEFNVGHLKYKVKVFKSARINQ